MESYKNYEKKTENQEGIPIPSRRSAVESGLLEFLRLREEIESHYKQIREKKARLEELVAAEPSIKSLDAVVRKVPRKEEEKKRKREEVVEETSSEEEEEAEDPKKKKRKMKNALNKKKQTHRSYLRQGYTMTEEEIAREGGEVDKQYVYQKDLGEGRVKVHVMKGMEGLKLSSTLGEEQREMEVDLRE